MAKYLNPKELDRRISRYGPYIYFFNANYPDYNKTMVEYLNKLASEYPALLVFELDWAKYFAFRPETHIHENYKVYLYCNNKKEDEKFMPDKKAMDGIFAKAIHLYNKFIEYKVNKYIIREHTPKFDEKYYSNNRKFNKSLYCKKWKKEKLMKAKIISKFHIENSENTKNKKIENSFKFENDKPENLIAKSVDLFNDNSQSLENQNSMIIPWFYNTRIEDLPPDVLKNDIQSDSKNYLNDNYSIDSSIQKSYPYIPRPQSPHMGNVMNRYASPKHNILNLESKNYTLSRNEVISCNKYLKDNIRARKTAKRYCLKWWNYKNKSHFVYSIKSKLKEIVENSKPKMIDNQYIKHIQEHNYSLISKNIFLN